MRVSCLLLMGIIPLSSFCQSSKLDHLLKENPYASLSKYSYLIITMSQNRRDTGRMDLLRNATGFFVKKGEKLFLVSAYHVFTGCPLYTDSINVDDKQYERPHALKIWYMNKAGKYVSKELAIPVKNTPCLMAWQQADVDVLDVTGQFKDGRIYSVERMVPNYWGEYLNMRPGDTIVGHGFSNVPTGNVDVIESNPPRTPDGYISLGVSWPDHAANSVIGQMDIIYYSIAPSLKVGASGAPIFKVSTDGVHNKRVEFIGVQSSSDSTTNRSAVAKGSEMMKRISHSK